MYNLHWVLLPVFTGYFGGFYATNTIYSVNVYKGMKFYETPEAELSISLPMRTKDLYYIA